MTAGSSTPLPELDAFFAPSRPAPAVQVFLTGGRWCYEIPGHTFGMGYRTQEAAQAAGDKRLADVLAAGGAA